MCNFILFHIINTNVKEGSRWQYNRHFFLILWHFTFNGVLPTRVNLCHYETILPSLSHPTILPCVLDILLILTHSVLYSTIVFVPKYMLSSYSYFGIASARTSYYIYDLGIKSGLGSSLIICRPFSYFVFLNSSKLFYLGDFLGFL